jgi:hypothetical protein
MMRKKNEIDKFESVSYHPFYILLFVFILYILTLKTIHEDSKGCQAYSMKIILSYPSLTI